jgi:acetyltransferase-like isoleucine patch superfamily enzyme
MFNGFLKGLVPRSLRLAAAKRRLSLKYPSLAQGTGCIVPQSTTITGPVSLGRSVVLAPEILLNHSSIGDYSYLGPRCSVSFAEVGKFCSIASEVHIGLGTHPLAPFVSTHPVFYLHRASNGWTLADKDYRSEFSTSTVGSDVWIGVRAAIKDGVRVGDGAVIAAGAVVVEDVSPYAIVGGVPAKLIRFRFPREIVQFLLDFRWWDHDGEWLRQNWSHFHDVHALMKDYPNIVKHIISA